MRKSFIFPIHALNFQGIIRSITLCCLFIQMIAEPQAYDVITISSPHFNSRGEMKPIGIITHCVGLEIPQIVAGFTLPSDAPGSLGVSSHYFIPQLTGKELKSQHPELFGQNSFTHPDQVPVIQFVKEEDRSWHAGPSHWGNLNTLPGCQAGLNSCTIGIEFHAPGYGTGENGTLDWFKFTSYGDAQIRTGALLMTDIVKRWGMDPKNILAHSDISPYIPAKSPGSEARIKTDPGPLFPWRQLKNEFKLGYLPQDVVSSTKIESPEDFVRKKLRSIGYGIPLEGPWGELERHCVHAYRMHFMADTALSFTPTNGEFGQIDQGLIDSLVSFDNDLFKL